MGSYRDLEDPRYMQRLLLGQVYPRSDITPLGKNYNPMNPPTRYVSDDDHDGRFWATPAAKQRRAARIRKFMGHWVETGGTLDADDQEFVAEAYLAARDHYEGMSGYANVWHHLSFMDLSALGEA